MRTAEEIRQDQERDEALMRVFDEYEEHIGSLRENYAYLRGYMDGLPWPTGNPMPRGADDANQG